MRGEGPLMKHFVLIVLIVAIAGCGAVKKEEQAVQARDAAMDIATQKMVVTRTNDVAGHSNLVKLGTVQGYCLANPEASDPVPLGDNLRQAAYRKYGDRVDGVIGAHGWFVPNENVPTAQVPYEKDGHFECAGTAVHFSD